VERCVKYHRLGRRLNSKAGIYPEVKALFRPARGFERYNYIYQARFEKSNFFLECSPHPVLIGRILDIKSTKIRQSVGRQRTQDFTKIIRNFTDDLAAVQQPFQIPADSSF
jgi:hypothetical protein